MCLLCCSIGLIKVHSFAVRLFLSLINTISFCCSISICIIWSVLFSHFGFHAFLHIQFTCSKGFLFATPKIPIKITYELLLTKNPNFYITNIKSETDLLNRMTKRFTLSVVCVHACIRLHVPHGLNFLMVICGLQRHGGHPIGPARKRKQR